MCKTLRTVADTGLQLINGKKAGEMDWKKRTNSAFVASTFPVITNTFQFVEKLN